MVQFHIELARRLQAAALSYRLGNKGVDHVLKIHLRDTDPGDYWIRLAQQIELDLARSAADWLGAG
jgi:hypothetical protein